jgi:DNA-binding NtrC family response regulator
MKVAQANSIVIVEDEDTLRTTLARALERRGYSVMEYADGLDAWRSLESSPRLPYALVTDLKMTRMNGNELLEKVLERRLSIPILVLMASDSRIWTGVMRNENGVFQLEKPFAIEQLVEILQSGVSA